MAGTNTSRTDSLDDADPGDRGGAGGGTADGARAFFPAKRLLDALSAASADGTDRRVVLGHAGEREVDVSIAHDANGGLLVGLVDPAAIDECEALRQLAHRMAAETDTNALLEILSVAAAKQCSATGAAVLKMIANEAELVVATGPLSAASGRRFGLRGSLAREVLRTRDIVTIDDLSRSDRPLTLAVPGLRVGPMLLAPLIAHEVVLGVITVVRDVGAPKFAPAEGRRLRVIADYAALALWKAELLEQAQVADRAKSRFLATVSHELRTPLTALAGYEELLVDQVIGPISDNQLDVLERMRSVTQHLASVIEDVLTFSSLDERRDVIRSTDFLAADLVRAAGAVIETLARQKKIAFSISVPPPDEPIRLNSDVDKIRQILINLAANAVKFTESGE
ncbi:MAG TPA: HAMP domain-containing sensor histidine kinase, partial [Gemmatimonadaceae bacterium]|nr:HAMP domain-containing sensor histidine kinase [Gemmatimonadaceae bacterium]